MAEIIDKIAKKANDIADTTSQKAKAIYSTTSAKARGLYETTSTKAKELYGTTSAKAKEIYDVTVYKAEIRKNEADLDECFESLGRAYYLNACEGESNDDKVAKLLERAEALAKRISDLKLKVAELQNKNICPHCKSVVSKELPYCVNCGQKMIAEQKNQ